MTFTQKQIDRAIKKARKTSTEKRAFNRALLVEQIKITDAYASTNLFREQAA